MKNAMKNVPYLTACQTLVSSWLSVDFVLIISSAWTKERMNQPTNHPSNEPTNQKPSKKTLCIHPSIYPSIHPSFHLTNQPKPSKKNLDSYFVLWRAVLWTWCGFSFPCFCQACIAPATRPCLHLFFGFLFTTKTIFKFATSKNPWGALTPPTTQGVLCYPAKVRTNQRSAVSFEALPRNRPVVLATRGITFHFKNNPTYSAVLRSPPIPYIFFLYWYPPPIIIH